MKNIETRTRATFTAKGGETVSYNEIFDTIRKNVEIYGKTKGCELSVEDLEDIFQEAALKAIRHSGTYDRAKSKPQTWGGMVAKNCCKDAIQSYKGRQERFTSLTSCNREGEEMDVDSFSEYAADDSYAADYETESQEALDRIEAAIDSLPENYAFILSLQREGMKPQKMAEEIGCPPNVVYTLLCRARKALARELGWEFLSRYGIPS